MLKHIRPASLHNYEARMLECAPWVGTDRHGAVRLVEALYDMSGADAHWVPGADFGGDPREDAPTVPAKHFTPVDVVNREIQGFRSMVTL